MIAPRTYLTGFLVLTCVCSVASVVPLFFYPMDCSPPGSSVHGILQARTLHWVALPSSRGSSQLRDERVSPVSPALQEDSLPTETPGKPYGKSVL